MSMRRPTPALVAALTALTLITAGCGEGHVGSSGDGDGPPTFETTVGLALVEERADRVVVDLWYTPAEGVPGPRAVELWLRIPAGLDYLGADPGEAVTAAGKTLVDQPRDDGELRLVAYGTASLERVAAGRLATLRFAVDPQASGPQAIEVLDRMPMFAPADANAQLSLPGPLVIGGD